MISTLMKTHYLTFITFLCSGLLGLPSMASTQPHTPSIHDFTTIPHKSDAFFTLSGVTIRYLPYQEPGGQEVPSRGALCFYPTGHYLSLPKSHSKDSSLAWEGQYLNGNDPMPQVELSGFLNTLDGLSIERERRFEDSRRMYPHLISKNDGFLKFFALFSGGLQVVLVSQMMPQGQVAPMSLFPIFAALPFVWKSERLRSQFHKEAQAYARDAQVLGEVSKKVPLAPIFFETFIELPKVGHHSVLQWALSTHLSKSPREAHSPCPSPDVVFQLSRLGQSTP